jgi:hypothetical protein
MEFQPEEPVDVVICIGVLAYVKQVETAIQKIGSLVKLGGRCVLQITDDDRVVGKIQRALWRDHFPLLSIGGLELERIAVSAGLSLRKRVNHYLVFPGMGRLPGRWLRAYDRFVLNSSILSRLAPSAIMLFERQGRSSLN